MTKVEYISDGTTTEFAFNFPFFDISDVRVVVNNVEQTDGFTVMYTPQAENADIPYIGTYVKFDVAPAKLSSVKIYRKIQLTRIVDYQPTVQIDPVALNQDINFTIEALKDFSQSLTDYDEKYSDLTNMPQLAEFMQLMSAVQDAISELDIGTIAHKSDLLQKANIGLNNLDATGRSAITNMIMPSNQSVNITDNGPGTTYTAPAAGYIMYRKTATVPGQYAELKNSTSGYDVIMYSSVANQSLTVTLMCAQGDSIEIWGTADGQTRWLKFVYARGEI